MIITSNEKYMNTNSKILLAYLVVKLVFCSNLLYSQDFSTKETVEDLEIKGDVVSVYEKEIAVKGTKYDLIRKNVISEVKYFIVDNKVFIDYYKNNGITTKYKYNSKNQVVEIYSFYSRDSSSAGTTSYYYDDSGNPTYEIIFSSKKKIQDSVYIFVDPLANFIIRRYFNNKKEIYKMEEKWYNAANKNTQTIQTINNSTTRLIYEYDSTLTKMIEEKWYLGNRLVQRIKYEYNDREHLIAKIELDEKGKQCALTQYEYDILSNLVVAMTTLKHTTNYEYNFDNNDNWITKYEFYDDYPVKITEKKNKYK
jgi:hypothetical protein